ncbi:transcriptional regulator [Rhodopseudomonas sp. WA056]|uniref:type IV toxin-antitoxin system AbiEi family antitoxin domain-containing protein n=1 Tax=Rhodopseudomonas sp. WA056 TaxID=2269367 RepID=UPI0013DE8421|nr:type IV toxin-antitoxin system AbiEi family antitoxin domain-containing protein [Rhodopseudomonas sp. WA056]NEW86217.1 transcriptional regulator [Rhodopseudomonas sp. WA056]
MNQSCRMTASSRTQSERVELLLRERGLVRAAEFRSEGISPTTISRMKERGDIVQLSRGLYQLAGAAPGVGSSLAEAAKLAPKGVVCLVSALAFHELTDTIPPRIWIAIGPKDWKPRVTQPLLQFVRFGGKVLKSGIEEHRIEGVTVRIYNPAKTVVDLFRYRQSEGRRFKRSPGLSLALEGMKEALRKRKATPAQIAKYAEEAGVWKVVRPYLDAMTTDG